MPLIRWSIPLILASNLVLMGIAWGQGSPQVSGAWQKVYERLPSFPKENQYVSQTTGTVKTSSTLANRLIQYHIFMKGRSPGSRLDWKLTLADYLGVNEPMFESRYPGIDELKVNPYERDLAIIRQLSRAQREELAQTLVSVFNPGIPKSNPASSPAPVSQPASTQTPPPASNPQLFKSPKAGDANLLKP
jgi:hypothetical protein